MDFSDIIKQNVAACSVKWWPKFAFHYTDVTNAVGILSSGYLYSRIQAQQISVMRNDNASIQVINMTESEATANARFYFRPLTPTQYYNEGYKHASIRYSGDENANVPVPIFLLFDLEKLISQPQTRFSELGQAGHGEPTYSGSEAFAKFDFTKIYSNGYADNTVRPYRHAEILYPGAYDIENTLKYILCRNEIEKTTLMNLLKAEDLKAFYKHKDKVKVCREDMFEKNGLYLDHVNFSGNRVSFAFADTYVKRLYARKQMERQQISELAPVRALFKFEWLSSRSTAKATPVHAISYERYIDYLNPGTTVFDALPSYAGAKTLRTALLVDNKIICCIEHSLGEIDLL